ncbi:hypothetical protein CYY_002316 [Polysphondylium violaceum]|uniref:Uncharacterized protein n=1 Tax=Polysphondylium violaceum TaxID=133409 RepID=A0A8J4Q1S5_9MYCE|nr:hypothetical protein CYY_002316 [Polysphondylium violaceum]
MIQQQTEYFFSIVRNKWIFNQILDLCKYQDRISYNFYDLPLALICKLKRFDIFDKKWHQKSLLQSPHMIDPKYMMDLDVKDIFEFFANNTSLKRFLMVWETMKPLVDNFDKMQKIIISSAQVKNIEEGIVETLLEFMSKTTIIYSNIKNAIYFGGYGSMKIINSFLGVADRTSGLCSITFLKQFLIGASKNGKKHTCIQLIHQIMERGFTEFDISDLSIEINDYLLGLSENVSIRLVVSSLPPQNLETIPWILAHRDKLIINSRCTSFLMNERIYLENKTFFEFMINKFKECYPNDRSPFLNGIPSIPNENCIETLEYILNVKDFFTFSSASLNSPFKLVDLIIKRHPRRIPFIEKEMKDWYFNDIRIVRLIDQVYNSPFTIVSLDGCVSMGYKEIVIFLLSKNNITINEKTMTAALVFPDIYNLLLPFVPKDINLGKIFESKSQVILNNLIVKGSLDGIKLFAEQCHIDPLSNPLYKVFNYSFSKTVSIVPKIYKYLLEPIENKLLDQATSTYSLNNLIHNSLNNRNYNLARYIHSIADMGDYFFVNFNITLNNQKIIYEITKSMSNSVLLKIFREKKEFSLLYSRMASFVTTTLESDQEEMKRKQSMYAFILNFVCIAIDLKLVLQLDQFAQFKLPIKFTYQLFSSFLPNDHIRPFLPNLKFLNQLKKETIDYLNDTNLIAIFTNPTISDLNDYYHNHLFEFE